MSMAQRVMGIVLGEDQQIPNTQGTAAPTAASHRDENEREHMEEKQQEVIDRSNEEIV